MDDYDAPVKKRKYTKRKKEQEVEYKKDPEQDMVRYVEDLERQTLRQQKVLEVSRAKHRLLISSFARMLDLKGIDGEAIEQVIGGLGKHPQERPQ